MKSIIFFILIFSFSTVYGQDITYNMKVVYQFKFQPDSTNVNSKITTENFLLYTGKLKSFYISANQHALDTFIEKATGVQDIGAMQKIPKSSSYKRIIKGISPGKLLVYDDLAADLVVYTDDVQLKWQLHPEKKDYSGMKLKKATTFFRGRNYIAWYNEDIPVSDGPYKFYGLPGLIIELHDEKMQYEWMAIDLVMPEIVTTLSLSYSKKAIATTRKDFVKASDEFFNDPGARLQSLGMVVSAEDKKRFQEQAKQRNKTNNNKIELTD